jgi:hypothetical protein
MPVAIVDRQFEKAEKSLFSIPKRLSLSLSVAEKKIRIS